MQQDCISRQGAHATALAVKLRWHACGVLKIANKACVAKRAMFVFGSLKYWLVLKTKRSSKCTLYVQFRYIFSCDFAKLLRRKETPTECLCEVIARKRSASRVPLQESVQFTNIAEHFMYAWNATIIVVHERRVPLHETDRAISLRRLERVFDRCLASYIRLIRFTCTGAEKCRTVYFWPQLDAHTTTGQSNEPTVHH